MECFGVVMAFFGLVGIVLSIIALSRAGNGEDLARALDRERGRELDRLRDEIAHLRRTLEELKQGATSPGEVRQDTPRPVPQPAPRPAPVPPPVPAPHPAPVVLPVAKPAHTELLEGPESHPAQAPAQLAVPASIPISGPPAAPPSVPSIPTLSASQAPDRLSSSAAPLPSRPIRPEPHTLPPAPPEPTWLDRMKGFNWEELLGTQVFLRLGVAVVVLGVVLFLGYVFAKMGPVGKVSMGVGAGLAMLGGGLYAEGKEPWRTFGRVIIAGGWGVLYFVAYAMRFLPASQVIQSTTIAVVLLMAIASAAVAFSLRYRHEWTTAFAFALIYLSLGLAALELRPPFNLTADLVASAALAALAWRLGWPRLLALGSLASWGCLAAWVLPHPELHRGTNLALKEAGMLATWLVFTLPALRWPDGKAERWLGGAFLASTLAAVGLGLQLAFDAGSSSNWILPLLIGSISLGMAFTLRAQDRRELFKLHATLGLLALSLVGPLRLGFRNGWVPVFRLLGIETLLAAGVFLRERYFRILAYLAFGFSFCEVFFLRLGLFGAGSTNAHARLALLSVAAAIPLMNAVLLRGPWSKSLEDEELAWSAPGMSAAGALFLASLIWIEAPGGAVALLLMLAAMLFQEAAIRSGLRDLHLESASLWSAALISLFTTSLPALAHHGRLPALALASASGAFYLGYLRTRLTGREGIPVTSRLRLGWSQLAAGVGLAIWLCFKEASPAWVAPALGALAFTHLVVALRSGYRELRIASGAFWISTLGSVAGVSWGLAGSSGLPHCSLRLLSVGGTLAVGYAGRLLLRTKGEGSRGIGWGLGLALPLVLASLIWTEAVPSWCAPLLAAAMILHLAPSILWGGAEGMVQGGILLVAALLAIPAKSWIPGGAQHLGWITPRLLSVGPTLILFYAAFAWTRFHEASPLDPSVRRRFSTALGAILMVVLVPLVFAEASALWCAPLLGLLMLIHVQASLWLKARALFIQGCVLAIAALASVAGRSWELAGDWHGVPARSVSVVLTVMACYLLHARLHAAERRGHALAEEMESSWHSLADAALLLATTVLALLVKAEALSHDKNLIVAPGWGLMGVIHLEGSRRWRRKSWFLLAVALLGAGAVHLLLVNLVQPGGLGMISFRTMTVLPFLGLLAYAHFGWDVAAQAVELPTSGSRLRMLGIHAGAVLGASYLLYELHRAWVFASWAAMALGYLLVWRRTRSRPLRWAATGLLLASLVRAAGTNLALRDELRGVRLNLVIVPVACVAILLCYLLLNREEPDAEGFRFAGSRTWLLALLGLATTYFYVEASGKSLTICWSLEGLAAVGLGFMVSERWARLGGLGLLSFCILKLFIYDLRGLEGLARIFSFIVLGLVLVGVSWVYTRFKDRLL